ncbi:hypothetical protein, partial [Akkermansia sp.]|uniref:hypothetical protein n=1 Tax=Akkermansia sp. TaxID=1872421 RepID=UPI003AACF625
IYAGFGIRYGCYSREKLFFLMLCNISPSPFSQPYTAGPDGYRRQHAETVSNDRRNKKKACYIRKSLRQFPGYCQAKFP